MANKPLVLTVREVSKILRLGRQKVYILIESGEIKGQKIGADWRITTASIEKIIGDLGSFFEENEEDTAAQPYRCVAQQSV